MKKEIYNKHRQNPSSNPIDAYFQGITHGVSQEALHTLEKEQAGIKSDITILKTDVAILKTDVSILKIDVAIIKTDIANIQNNIKENVATKADLANLKTELKEDIAKLSGCVAMIRAESKEDIANVRAEISSFKLNMQGWMITILITIIGGIITLLYKF